jgi:hypothetical protein
MRRIEPDNMVLIIRGSGREIGDNEAPYHWKMLNDHGNAVSNISPDLLHNPSLSPRHSKHQEAVCELAPVREPTNRMSIGD